MTAPLSFGPPRRFIPVALFPGDDVLPCTVGHLECDDEAVTIVRVRRCPASGGLMGSVPCARGCLCQCWEDEP